MFGTIAMVQVQPGKEEQFLQIGEEWTRERGPVTGQVGAHIFKLTDRPGAYAIVGIFSSEEVYRANAADPETDRWYRKMRETLVSDPQWHDGEVISQMTLAGI
jgi:quinol monooxygenase YgiN